MQLPTAAAARARCRNTGGRLAGITGYAAKGSRKLYVDNTNGIRQGDWVRVILSDSSESAHKTRALPSAAALLAVRLRQHAYHAGACTYAAPLAGEVLRSNLMAGLMDAGWNKGGARNVVRFSSRVTEVGGGVVTLERALPWEVKTQWGPGLHAMRPALTDVGVEALTIEFAHTNCERADCAALWWGPHACRSSAAIGLLMAPELLLHHYRCLLGRQRPSARGRLQRDSHEPGGVHMRPCMRTAATSLQPRSHHCRCHPCFHVCQVSNGWIKDVTILNADTGIYFWGVTFSTVQDVLLDTTR